MLVAFGVLRKILNTIRNKSFCTSPVSMKHKMHSNTYTDAILSVSFFYHLSNPDTQPSTKEKNFTKLDNVYQL